MEPLNNPLVGSRPHPVMDTTKDYCWYMKVLLPPYKGAVAAGAIDLIP